MSPYTGDLGGRGLGRTAMSASELRRAGILARVAAETLTLTSAASLMEVSYRQAKRLYGRYRAEGAKGLKHRSAGRASNRATDARRRRRVLALVREKYSGSVDDRFGPTLAAEHLATEDGITIDHETLRRWMLAEGLWSRARKRSPHRRRRARMAHFGELVQLDGSFHPWFEDRGPHSCLLTLVDDATGRSFGQFGAQETIWAAVGILRAWIERYGVPRALYTDWKNVYVRRPNQEERETGAEPLTQFGRMCAALGIKIIPASSPQAKGRIERNHGTHQDRLVKKLRRKGVADIETANAFLDATYWADHNRRFAQAPTSAEDFHLAVPRRVSLDQVFRLEHKRTVSNDWVVQYDNRLLQLERQSGRPPARSTVLVYEAMNGQLEIRYRDRVMRWTEIQPQPQTDAVEPRTVPNRPARPRVRRLKPRRVCDDHPWRRKVDEYRLDQQLAADRKAYAAVNP
jgi:transposase